MSSMVLSGDTSGSVTVTVPAVAGTNTITLPAATGTVMVNGPAFSAYASATQAISNATYTKVTLNSKDFDTNNNFDNTTNYRFTPTVAGYYQISASIFYNTGASSGLGQILIYKNGSLYKGSVGVINSTGNCGLNISSAIYCNGSTDYIELYTYQSFGTTQSTSSGAYVFMSGAMVRSA